ncbi:hypothetical protein [Oceanobacillus sp. CF4.6]|uniref:hypothetical protein n=1 Tax=Oceanobacillus sp. CF4.6 TaxID=3373080 RepID=UPI003EE69591
MKRLSVKYPLVGIASVAVIGFVGFIGYSIVSAEPSESKIAAEEETEKIVQTETIEDQKTHDNIKEQVGDGDLEYSHVIADSSSVSPENKLTKDGFSNPLFYTSNFKLDKAHSLSSILAEKASVKNNGEPLAADQVRSYLEDIRFDLMDIEYSGEKEEELQKAIDLTSKAFMDEAKLGDPILDDIHTIIHELNIYFNLDSPEY